MQGRVFKRSSTWTYVVDVGVTADGRRKQKSKGGFTTRRAAEAALTEVMSALATGSYMDPAKLSFEQYVLNDWLPAMRATVRPLTWESYDRHCRKYLVPAFGRYPLHGVSVVSINALYGTLLRPEPPTSALSASTIRRIHATLHKALADAVRWQLIARNPAAFADPPRAAKPEMNVWSASDLQDFLVATGDDRLATLWLFMALTGVRRGEALGLRWSDVDLERGRAAIRQTILPIGHRAVVGEPKTARGRRSVALDQHTVEALRAHRKRQLEQRLLVGREFHDKGLIFARPDGEPLNPEYVSRRFQRLVRSLGLPPVRLHDLRIPTPPWPWPQGCRPGSSATGSATAPWRSPRTSTSTQSPTSKPTSPSGSPPSWCRPPLPIHPRMRRRVVASARGRRTHFRGP